MKTIKNKVAYEQDINDFKGKVSSIVFPDSLEEIKNLIKITKMDIIPRGAGINFCSSTLPNNSVIIDMSKMNKILEVNSNRKTATIEPGVIFDELNQEVSKYNLELPIDPIFSGIRTLGGMVATNASGSRELKYGKLKNWIDSLEIINGKGEIMEIGKSDIDDFAGLEGITGIITKIRLRLTTKKQRTLSIYKADSVQEILELNKKFKLEQEVSMTTMLNKNVADLLGLENKHHLIVEYENSRGAMRDENYDRFMKLKNKAYYVLASFGYTILENPKFYLDSFKEFIILLEENKVPYFSDVSSGVVYPCFKPEETEKHEFILNKIKRLRGRISHNLGIGLTKKDFLERNEKEIIKRIKLRYDPDNKFNRNKLIDDLTTTELSKEIIEEPETEPEPETTELPTEEDVELPNDEIKEQEDEVQEEKTHSLTVGEVLEEMEREKKEKKEKKIIGDEDGEGGFLDELKTPEEKMEDFIVEQEAEDEAEKKEQNNKDEMDKVKEVTDKVFGGTDKE